MDLDDNESIPVYVNNPNPKVVYAIPAKPKPPAPWWQENFGGLVILWGCIVFIFILLGE